MGDPSRLLPPLPLMAREPFPVDLITVEKLDQILGFLKRDASRARVRAIEGRLNEVQRDMRDIKSLLVELVGAERLSSVALSQSQRPSQASRSPSLSPLASSRSPQP